MKQSKKGITLVELVICCAIIVLLGGACTAVLVSGQTIFNTSSKTANAQLDADVLQTYLMNLLPPAKNVAIDIDGTKNLTSENCIYFDSNVFTLNVNGDKTTIRSIKEFKYSIVRAGADSSDSARAQLQYTITLTDGSEISGGFVLANVKFADTWASEETTPDTVDLENDSPLYFNIPETP